jgi:uroporphyrinogen-III decarboxylase
MSFVPPSKWQTVKGLLYGKGLRIFKLDPNSRNVAAMLGKPDFIPPSAGQIHVHSMTVAKADPKRFIHDDGKYCADVQFYVQRWYDFDQPFVLPPETYNYEIEALGGSLLKTKNHMSSIDHNNPLIKKEEDIDKIQLPIEKDWGRVQYVIDCLNEFKELFGTTPTGVFCGPFSFICGIHSYVGVIRDIRKNPDFVHRLLKWTIDEVSMPYLQLLKQETGFDVYIGADAWSAIPDTNKKIVEEFVLPYNAYLREQAKKVGITANVAASADYCEENPNRFDPELMKWSWYIMGMELMGRPFLPMGMGRPELWPMDVMQEFIKENTTRSWTPAVMASCSARFIRDSTPQEIVDYIKRIIDGLGRDGHMMFFFVQIPADTPPVNVHTAVKALKTFGKYPIAENLDDIPFEVPEFEPYHDWLKREIAEGRVIDYE